MAHRPDDHEWDEAPDTDRSEGDEPEERPTRKPRLLERIRGSVQSATNRPGTTGLPTKSAIYRLDARERRFSFAAAGGAAIFGTIIYLMETNNPNFHLKKGQLTPQTSLILGLAAAGLLLITTLIGRRAPVGFVALFTFLAFGSNLLLGLPFLAFAFWLLYRSYKIQRETATNIRAAQAGSATKRASTSRSSAARSPSSRSAVKSTGKRDRKKGPATPEANKRYTPKRPPPPTSKPSRRERKASQATE